MTYEQERAWQRIDIETLIQWAIEEEERRAGRVFERIITRMDGKCHREVDRHMPKLQTST